VRPEIARALDEAETASRRSVIVLFRDLVMPVLGLRLRDPGAGLDHLVMAGGVLIQGMALRQILAEAASGEQAGPDDQAGPDEQARGPDAGAAAGDPALTSAQLLDTPLPGPGLDGQPAAWTLVALSYLGLVDMFVEPDPGYRGPGAAELAG
jgi:hypothetical protein